VKSLPDRVSTGRGKEGKPMSIADRRSTPPFSWCLRPTAELGRRCAPASRSGIPRRSVVTGRCPRARSRRRTGSTLGSGRPRAHALGRHGGRAPGSAWRR